MIRPGISKYDWEVELSDSKSRKRYGLKVPQGSLQIGTVSQDDTVYVRNVGKRVGDFDEQRSWKGGRGQENLSENAEAFYDSYNGWSLTPGHVHQTLQWYHARGLRNEDMYMPTRSAGSVQFQPLIGSTKYISNSFSASASYSTNKVYLWIRRRGSPGTLTIRLMSDSAGSPNTELQSTTKTITDITDYISVYEQCVITSQALTSGTTYWVSVHGDTNDNRDNHWEIGVNPSVSSGKISSDGSIWASSTFALYYRFSDPDTINRRFFRFFLNEAMYIIDRKENNSTASKLYINGDRGKATAGAASSLTDSVKSWTTNRFANAWVKIINGTGSKNQPKQIASNTGTVLTITGTWETNPSTDSEYIIYGTEWFTEITPSGGSLSVCSGEPAVVNNVAYIPQGTTGIAHVRWNNSTLAHDISVESASGTSGLADLLFATTDPADGPILWRANNTANTGSGGRVTVSRANLMTSGAFIAWNTALTWKTAIFTGSTSFYITGMGKKDNQLYVFREDGLGVVSNDRYNTVDAGIEKTPDRANGRFVISHGQFLFYSWLHSLVRVYGSSHDDVGDDYRSVGLPDGREGEYADGDTYLKLLFCAIDADSGWSSVLAWDGLGWHEMIRSRRSGERIQFVKVQTCQGTRNRLWTQMRNDLVFQELPLKKASPRLDSGATFMHEAVIESAAIDMGTASAMPKLIKDLTVTVKNLNANGREIFVDIQTDDDVHTTNWTPAGVLTKSPESSVFLGINCNRFAYRLRMCSNNNTIPIDIEGVVPNGYARTPFKMVFTMTIQAGGIFSRRGKLATSGELMRWLLDQSRIAGFVNMSSVYEMAHNWKVVVHPPRQFPMVPKKGRNPESASITISLQEV